MRMAQVTVGGRYTCKVSGRIVVVEILAEADSISYGRKRGRFQARNLETGRTITVSALRLRAPVRKDLP